jgi:hypothetical protein
MSHRHISSLSSELAWAKYALKRCHEALARAQQNLQAALFFGRLKKNMDNLQ